VGLVVEILVLVGTAAGVTWRGRMTAPWCRRMATTRDRGSENKRSNKEDGKDDRAHFTEG